MKVDIIIQARLGSMRFPRKVLQKVNGISLIDLIFFRLQKVRSVADICLATTTNEIDDELSNLITGAGFKVFRGSENDVLDRYFNCAKYLGSDVVVRITGDCPLVDYEIVENLISKCINSDYDYVSNTIIPTYPDGYDVEVFKFNALQLAHDNAVDNFDREHVTPFIKRNSITLNSEYFEDISHLRLTVDERDDLVLIRNIYSHFHENIFFKIDDILDLYKSNPSLFDINKNLIRNEGSTMNKGQKLWRRAKNVIPGGNMLLSKKSEMFLPNLWPSYFSRAKGCHIWDLDNTKYTDVSLMGVGTNILGYGHEAVDSAVHDVVTKGNMSTFNCPEEVLLAEKLVEMHPWSDMVKLARTGGEANAVAIRLARAASGRNGVAFCGYHGWHDWYLAANLQNQSNLDSHLLSGLDAKGVPHQLSGTMFPFQYNNFEQLESIISKEKIGVIFMEVMRNYYPADNFLQRVRDIASKNGIVLVFDECTSGFRESYGGLHLKYGVEPDLATFGKALGNGYAITAIIGREIIMRESQNTFISSTFWTERIGPTAALATLKVMDELKSWDLITNIGNEVRKKLELLAVEHKLEMEILGLPSMLNYKILDKNWPIIKTYITQEMLKYNYLASNSIYSTISHAPNIIDDYFEKLYNIFKIIGKYKMNDEDFPSSLLDDEVSQSGFTRVN